jgi:predicted lipoprotein with Yx(FWY)xxD motif
MKWKLTAIVAAVSLVGAVAVGGALATSSSRSNAAVVAIGKTKLGRVLVDSRGRTLYLFDRDKSGRSACYGTCARYWPPLLTSAKPRAGTGVRASLLGMTKRRDGKQQVTYARHPLYTYIGDTKRGQTTGEGLTDFGAAWDAVAPSGRSIESDAAGAPTSGGYGG